MRNILLILLFIFTSTLFAQKYRFSYDLGYGVYSLNNIKKFQSDYASQINNLPVQVIVQFPDYINHSASICFYLDESNLLGVNSAYLTTGGRNSLIDYSGGYKLDMILNGYQFGIESEHIRQLKNNFYIHYNFKLGLIMSVLKSTEILNINDVGESSSTDEFKQFGFFLEPNINVSKNISTNFAINLCLGYSLNTSSFYKGIISWDGLRPKLGMSYSF